MVDAIQQSGRTAVLFICRHNIEDPAQPILLRDTIVTEAYYNGGWENLTPRTALEAWEYAIKNEKRKERGDV